MTVSEQMNEAMEKSNAFWLNTLLRNKGMGAFINESIFHSCLVSVCNTEAISIFLCFFTWSRTWWGICIHIIY